jgi:5-methylthioadenosine/S-adenosylhomocysteine deaminase
LEVGKRADLILVDIRSLHNAPRFRREPDGIYAQLVYAGHATDVVDLMVNGRWLMHDRRLLTLDESDLLAQAQDLASLIDLFLIDREQSVLSKLITIGGATEEESFEVQAKVRLTDPAPVMQAIQGPGIEVLHHRHYHEYDTYFSFADPEQGHLRYREDEYIGKNEQVSNIRYRLTLLGQARERSFPSDVLLSRSRFLATATHSLRFYREYFKPTRETIIEKDRLRWRVLFKGTEFYINLDRVINPSLGYFLEVKSRTWSRRDAEHKAIIAQDLIQFLEAAPQESVSQDYIEIVENQ